MGKKQTPDVAPAPAAAPVAAEHPMHGGVYERAPDGAVTLVEGVDDHPMRPGAEATTEGPMDTAAGDAAGDLSGDINTGA